MIESSLQELQLLPVTVGGWIEDWRPDHEVVQILRSLSVVT